MASKKPLAIYSGQQWQLKDADDLIVNGNIERSTNGVLGFGTNNYVNSTVNLATGANIATVNIGTGTGAADNIYIGGSGSKTTVQGNLQVDGTETVIGTTTFEGNTIIGDDDSDTLTIEATIQLEGTNAASLLFASTADHVLKVADSGTGAGGDITIRAGAGFTSSAGGDASLIGGEGTGAVGGAAYVTGGASTTTVGGAVTIKGGLGANGSTGGAVYVQGGDAGAGTHGTVYIGNTDTATVIVGAASTAEIGMTVHGNILPGTADTHDLGASGTEWDYVYANHFVGAFSPSGHLIPAADKTYNLGEDSTPLRWLDLATITVTASSGTASQHNTHYSVLTWTSLTMTAPTENEFTLTAAAITSASGGNNVTVAGGGESSTYKGGTAKLIGGASASGTGGDAKVFGGNGGGGTHGSVYLGTSTTAATYIGAGSTYVDVKSVSGTNTVLLKEGTALSYEDTTGSGTFAITAQDPTSATAVGNKISIQASDGGATSGAGGDVDVLGGAGVAGDSDGGDVNLAAGLGVGTSVNGQVNLKVGTTSLLECSFASALGYIIVQSGSTLSAEAGGMIDLPSLFEINGTAVGATVTAANLDELTDGSETTLHTHAGGGGSSFTATSGEAINLHAPVVLDYNGSSEPRVYNANATGCNGTAARKDVVGINTSTGITGAGQTMTIQVTGEIEDIADSIFDSAPGVTNVGQRVYLDDTAGKLTLTAPDDANEMAIRVGWLTLHSVGDSASNVVIHIGEGTIN